VTGDAGFKKPKQNIFKKYLYLDSEQVLNALSSLQGGDVDEVLTRTTDAKDGEFGVSVGAGPIRGKSGRKHADNYQEEMTRKRTEHSAATLLLTKLNDADAIGRLTRFGAVEHAQLEQGMLLEFSADLRLHPLHQVATAVRSWEAVARKFGGSKEDLAAARTLLSMLELLLGGSEGRRVLAYAVLPDADDDHRLILNLSRRYISVSDDDFIGHATCIAQIENVLSGDDESLAVRFLADSPVIPQERVILAEMPETLEGLEGLIGVRVTDSDLVFRSPAVVLNPVVIYR